MSFESKKRKKKQPHDVIDFGHTDTCRLVFNMLYVRLVFFANKIIEDDIQAKDIVQDAFLYLMEKKLSFNDINGAKSYLYTYVKHKCLNYLRDFREKISLDEIERMPSKDASIDKLIIEQELRGRIIDQINRLTDTEKKIMLLRLEEKSYNEISEMLSLAISTVKTHKKAAYRKIRIGIKTSPPFS